MLDVFERIVEQELNFGDVLQLVAEPLAQGAADEPVLVFEPLHHLAALLKGEDADVDFGVAEIGGYAYGGDRYERRTIGAPSFWKISATSFWICLAIFC